MRPQTQQTEGPSHPVIYYEITCLTCRRSFRHSDLEAECPWCADDRLNQGEPYRTRGISD